MRSRLESRQPDPNTSPVKSIRNAGHVLAACFTVLARDLLVANISTTQLNSSTNQLRFMSNIQPITDAAKSRGYLRVTKSFHRLLMEYRISVDRR